jgi:hypothetical protein
MGPAPTPTPARVGGTYILVDGVGAHIFVGERPSFGSTFAASHLSAGGAPRTKAKSPKRDRVVVGAKAGTSGGRTQDASTGSRTAVATEAATDSSNATTLRPRAPLVDGGAQTEGASSELGRSVIATQAGSSMLSRSAISVQAGSSLFSHSAVATQAGSSVLARSAASTQAEQQGLEFGVQTEPRRWGVDSSAQTEHGSAPQALPTEEPSM